MKKRSEFGKINGTDLLNALYHGVGASIIPIIATLNSGKAITETDYRIALGAFLGAIVFDIFKRSLTNSDGELTKK